MTLFPYTNIPSQVDCHLLGLFWTVYITNKELSIQRGQPATIQDEACDLTITPRYDSLLFGLPLLKVQLSGRQALFSAPYGRMYYFFMCRELDRKNKCINQHKPPHWKSLSDAGFDTIDAAMSVPGGKDEAYLFRGTKYVRLMSLTTRSPMALRSWLMSGRVLRRQALIQSMPPFPVPNAKVDGETYFFKGWQYARIQVVRSGADKVTWGPHSIADYWKTLDWI